MPRRFPRTSDAGRVRGPAGDLPGWDVAPRVRSELARAWHPVRVAAAVGEGLAAVGSVHACPAELGNSAEVASALRLRLAFGEATLRANGTARVRSSAGG